jgi:hypothetical protein
MQRLEPNGPPAGGEEKIFLEMPLKPLSGYFALERMRLA